MNVIITNKQKSVIDNANIDAIKDLNGLFTVDDLVSKFKNYFFSKMILDATSIVDFTNSEVLEKLVKEIGSEKLVILLPSAPEVPDSFIDKLIELKIYNFSTDINDIVKFISMPNTYENALKMKKVSNDDIYVDSSIKANDDYYESDNEQDLEVDKSFEEENVEENKANDDFNYNQYISNDEINIDNNTSKKYVIGIKNVTVHAGSTSLCFMLSKITRDKLGKSSIVVEVNKDELKYYQDKSMISVTEENLFNTLNQSKAQIIFVDLNSCKDLSSCDEVLYLVEPSTIKLNKLMLDNRYAFRELFKKKIVLNQSFLNSNEVNALSKEAGVEMYFNLPSLNDRMYNEILIKLLNKLGVK